MSLELEIQRLTENDSPHRKAEFARMVGQSVRAWEQFMREDQELARLELAIAHAARILVTEHPSSPQYAQALSEDRKLRDRRYELWQTRAQNGRPSQPRQHALPITT